MKSAPSILPSLPSGAASGGTVPAMSRMRDSADLDSAHRRGQDAEHIWIVGGYLNTELHTNRLSGRARSAALHSNQ